MFVLIPVVPQGTFENSTVLLGVINCHESFQHITFNVRLGIHYNLCRFMQKIKKKISIKELVFPKEMQFAPMNERIINCFLNSKLNCLCCAVFESCHKQFF